MRNHRKIEVSWLKKEKLLPLTGYLIVFALLGKSDSHAILRMIAD